MVEFQWFLMELSVLFERKLPFNLVTLFESKKNKQCVCEIIVPSREKFGNLCPAVAKPFVGLIDYLILFLSPWRLLHLWVEVIVPPFTALFPNSSLEVFCYHRPALGAILVNQVNNLPNTIRRRTVLNSKSAISWLIHPNILLKNSVTFHLKNEGMVYDSD